MKQHSKTDRLNKIRRKQNKLTQRDVEQNTIIGKWLQSNYSYSMVSLDKKMFSKIGSDSL